MSESHKKLTPVLSSTFSIPKGIVPKELVELSGEEKLVLKKLLLDPTMIRAMEYAHVSKPSAFMQGATTEQKTDRLSEIRGWEACVAAIYIQMRTEVYDFGKHKDTPYTYTNDNLNTHDDDG